MLTSHGLSEPTRRVAPRFRGCGPSAWCQACRSWGSKRCSNPCGNANFLLTITRSSIVNSSRSAGAAPCPNWADPRANGSAVGINRKSLGWSASAAHFAYGYGRLALAGFRYIGLDDLACGPYPDNEPAVTGMDWQTGEPNARFFVVKMLISALGSGPKALLHANVTQTGSAPPA